VIRTDFLVRRTGPGKADLYSGELTELGGCFLGWRQGPQHIWRAVVSSVLPAGHSELPGVDSGLYDSLVDDEDSRKYDLLKTGLTGTNDAKEIVSDDKREL